MNRAADYGEDRPGHMTAHQFDVALLELFWAPAEAAIRIGVDVLESDIRGWCNGTVTIPERMANGIRAAIILRNYAESRDN